MSHVTEDNGDLAEIRRAFEAWAGEQAPHLSLDRYGQGYAGTVQDANWRAFRDGFRAARGTI